MNELLELDGTRGFSVFPLNGGGFNVEQVNGNGGATYRKAFTDADDLLTFLGQIMVPEFAA